MIQRGDAVLFACLIVGWLCLTAILYFAGSTAAATAEAMLVWGIIGIPVLVLLAGFIGDYVRRR